MIDDRLSRYLQDQAEALPLDPAGPEAVVRRAQRRRNGRRAVAAVTAVAVIGAGATALAQRDGTKAETAAAPGVEPSPFDWTVVPAESGLGTVRSLAALDGGQLYGLSTAPGPVVDERGWSEPPQLYRSTDGAEWAPVDLPADLHASALAGSGSRLYAVGTSPAGGGSQFEVASFDDGTGWTTASLPSRLNELQARYPGEVVTVTPNIAANGGTVVVTASYFGVIDVMERLPQPLADDAAWVERDEGVDLYSCGSTSGVAVADARGVPTSTTSVAPDDDAVAARLEEAAAAAGTVTDDPCGEGGTLVGSYTWADLDVPDELATLARQGRTELFVATGDQPFAPLDLGDLLPTGRWTGSTKVVAGDTGFTVFAATTGGTDAGTTLVLRSTDGLSWTEATRLPGSPASAGTIQGRAAVQVTDWPTTTIHIERADGGWTAVDPVQAIDGEGWVNQVAFGPLGWTAAVSPGAPDAEPSPTVLVHSVDGTTMSLVPLGDLGVELRSWEVPSITVSADAVLVRVSRPDGDPLTVEPQEVVVGTPRG
ncbi:MAG: hypothetical protein AB7L84_13565 [Acidimicrobiia bacterium]